MGKTAVYIISILNRLQPNPAPLTGLVLVHTRELTQQIQKEFERLGKFRTDITSNVVYGGVPLD